MGDSRGTGATPSPPPSRSGGVRWSAVCANCEGLPLTLQHRATHTPPQAFLQGGVILASRLFYWGRLRESNPRPSHYE